MEIFEKGFGFLRSIENNFLPTETDTFVPARFIKELNLPEGVYIEGNGSNVDKGKSQALTAIEKINDILIDDYGALVRLHQQISISPTERFILTQGRDDMLGKALDMIVPMGRGQRGLIISPPKSGKTTILKHMANSIATGYDNARVFVLLVDERPEEVTDFKRGLNNAWVLASSADQSVADHLRVTRLTVNAAIAWTEAGNDAVLFIDSLTRMTRAFNSEIDSGGRTMTGGLGANTMEIPRQIFGAARNLEDAGSLTMIATILVDTGSRMDDIIYQEFKGTGNMDLVLSRKCAEQRLWPAVNINQSGTRKEELLLTKKELREIINIRRALAQMDETTALSHLLEHIHRRK